MRARVCWDAPEACQGACTVLVVLEGTLLRDAVHALHVRPLAVRDIRLGAGEGRGPLRELVALLPDRPAALEACQGACMV